MGTIVLNSVPGSVLLLIRPSVCQFVCALLKFGAKNGLVYQSVCLLSVGIGGNQWAPSDITVKELAMQFSHFYNGSLALTYLTNLVRPYDLEPFFKQNLVAEVPNFEKFKVGHLSDQIPWKKVQGHKVMINWLKRSTPKSHF